MPNAAKTRPCLQYVRGADPGIGDACASVLKGR